MIFDYITSASQSRYLQSVNSTPLDSATYPSPHHHKAMKPVCDVSDEVQASPLSLRSNVHYLVLSVLEVGDFLDSVKSRNCLNL